jgi:hypothetical protein
LKAHASLHSDPRQMMQYRSWLIYISEYTKNRLHGLRTRVDRVCWLFYFKVQLRVNAVVRDRHVGASMNQDQVSCEGTDLGLREPGSSTNRCTKGPQVFSCAGKPSESSVLSLLWRVRLRACRRMASSPIGEISKRADVWFGLVWLSYSVSAAYCAAMPGVTGCSRQRTQRGR